MNAKEALKELEDLTVDYCDRNERQIERLDEAIGMAIDALRPQDGDTISRKAVLNTVNATRKRCDTDSLDDYHALLTEAVENLPPAQPEMLACGEGVLNAQPVDKGTNVPVNDLISRQAAIDFIDAGHLCNPNEPRWSDNEVVNFLKSRPSAQPETHEERTETHACDYIERQGG